MKSIKNVSWSRVDFQILDLEGTKVAVIGGTGGIGRAISNALASKGAEVIVVGQTFRDSGVKNIEFMQADLSSMSESQRVAKKLPSEKLDLLVFTAGIFAAPIRQETAEGIERDMAISYLSRLVILKNILPILGSKRKSSRNKPRVFIMGFPGKSKPIALDDLNFEKNYKSMSTHLGTVTGNELLVTEYAKSYNNVNFYGLNPGLIKTEIRSNFMGAGSLKHKATETLIGLMTPTADTYARSIIPLMVSPDLENHSGAIFDRKGNAVMPSRSLTTEYSQKFLSASEQLIASKAGNVVHR